MPLWYMLPLLFLTAGYAFLLLFLAVKITRRPLRRGDGLPTLSVIVPAHNEADRLPPLLACLEEQRYPDHLCEYIVVDDRSADATGELLAAFCRGRGNRTLITIPADETGPSPKKRAITAGIAAAVNDIIITTDADTLPPPGWLASTASRFTDEVTMVIGYAPYRTDGPFRTLFHRLLAFDYMAMGTIAAAAAAAGQPATSFGANLSYRRRCFQEIGGFGESGRYLSGDDDLLMHRFHDAFPGTVVFNPDPESAVPTMPPRTFRDFIRQRLRFSSKHTAYPGRLLFWMILIYAYNGILAAGLAGALFDTRLLMPAALGLAGKGVLDVTLLIRGRRLLQERNFLPLYPLAAIPHLLYVVCVPLFSRFIPRKW